MDNTSATRTSWRPHWRRAASLPQNSSRMQKRELHGDHCARKEFKTLKLEEFSPYRRRAAVESLEPLQPSMNSDVTYAVVTASPELVYTRTDDDILDPEVRRVDGSIQAIIRAVIVNMPAWSDHMCNCECCILCWVNKKWTVHQLCDAAWNRSWKCKHDSLALLHVTGKWTCL